MINEKDLKSFSLNDSSTLDSFGKIFNKNENNFSTSSEIAVVQLENEKKCSSSLSIDLNLNQTFTKEKTKTMINAFTGKPISPNPWRKLSTKYFHQKISIPREIEKSPEKCSNDDQIKQNDEEEKISNRRRSRRDSIDHQRIVDNDQEEEEDDDNDQTFERSLEEEKIVSRSKLNPSQSSSSSSSSSRSSSLNRDRIVKINRRNSNEFHLQKLSEIYTSEESDEKISSTSSKQNFTIRLKSEIYTSDHSTRSSSSSSSNHSTIDQKLNEEKRKCSWNFLQSLSESIPFEEKHFDAKPYFLGLTFKSKAKREELSKKLFEMFNKDVFQSKFGNDVEVVWSARLTATAGHCTTRRKSNRALITLSQKICDTPERCRDTLLHEMCHAAVTLIDRVMEQGHGSLWRQWTRMAERCYPYLPLISVRHNYQINYQFIYRCLKCQHQIFRHSKSINLQIDCCGKCFGSFQLLNSNSKSNEKKNNEFIDRETPKKRLNRYNSFVKENFSKVKQSQPQLSTPQIMKQLTELYHQQHDKQRNLLDLSHFDQLNIS